MKIRALSLVLLMGLGSAWADDETLKLSATKTWTVDSARQEAFENAPHEINTSSFVSIDPNLIENKQAITLRQKRVGHRLVDVFSDGVYFISELCDPYSYYYLANGRLDHMDYRSVPAVASKDCPVSYPSKGYKFLYPSGNLSGVFINIAAGESYLFYPDGSLHAHWIGHNCYQTDGSSCGTRHEFLY